ncbi:MULTISPECIES: hypothetical protein [Methanobacterium]|uniref:Uncharacterized protein n=1 Tax=Methanobacterium veterum TaxID=408577 RepID=A0A9E5DKK4_9EURY|nr:MULTISPECIES: hypothetical protein [Methanobacterium]MCZ3364874.1 hypothetical protein [Methanobacterium veterum]MCZ3372629.1 hypothetical protein [Methanobacterium veterum]
MMNVVNAKSVIKKMENGEDKIIKIKRFSSGEEMINFMDIFFNEYECLLYHSSDYKTELIKNELS